MILPAKLFLLGLALLSLIFLVDPLNKGPEFVNAQVIGDDGITYPAIIDDGISPPAIIDDGITQPAIIDDGITTPSCPVTSDQYPQCGGTTGLEDKDPTHTYMITRFTDCNGNIAQPYQTQDLGNLGQCAQASTGPSCTPNDQISTTRHCLSGTTQMCTFNVWRGSTCNTGEGGPYNCQNDAQCGYQQPAPVTPAPVAPAPASVQPAPQPQLPACPTPGQAGTVRQSQCNFQWTYDDFRVIERWSDGSPKSIYSEYTQNRHCQGTILCARPAQAPPQECTPSTRQDRECVGTRICTVNVTRHRDCTVSRSAPFDCQNSILCGFRPPQPPAPPSAGGPVNVGPISTGPVNVTTGPVNVSTGPVTQTVNVPAQQPAQRETVKEVRVVTAQAAQPGQVAGVQYKELPKTGLPALAWTALAFIPAGFRLRRLGSVKKDALNNPNYLWEDRQFKVN